MKNYFFILLLVISLNGFTQKISVKLIYVISTEPISDKKIDSITKNSKIRNVKVVSGKV